MIILAIARKTLREYFREPALISFVLVGPVLLVWLFYSVYAPVKDNMADFVRVAVINQDAGPQGAELTEALRAIEFDGKPAVGVLVSASRQEAETAVREGKVPMLLSIPENFSSALDSVRAGGKLAIPPAVEYIGDTASLNFIFTKAFLDESVRSFIRFRSGQGEAPRSRYEFLPGTGTSADFDSSVPGLLVFSMSMLLISTAITLVREDVAATLTRLRLARLRASEFLCGIGLAQGVLSAWMILLGFGAAVALGFGRGSEMLAPARIFWLLIVSQLFAVACIGIGMIIAAFSRTDGDAANLGSMFLLPLVFLSGILFPMPPVELISLGGISIGVYDLLPSTLAAEILRRAVGWGEAPSAFVGILAGLCLELLVVLAVGSSLYQHRRLARG
jgi:ABC-2 type transport system permease protein